MVAAANALAEFLFGNAGAVLAVVQENYLASCWNEDWMNGCGVPVGLSVAAMCKYLSDSTIAVDLATDGGVSAVIYFSPQWDLEHGLYLKVEGGRVVRTDP